MYSPTEGDTLSMAHFEGFSQWLRICGVVVYAGGGDGSGSTIPIIPYQVSARDDFHLLCFLFF